VKGNLAFLVGTGSMIPITWPILLMGLWLGD
jgi:hypothetical protein